jgi:hypothetical protein
VNQREYYCSSNKLDKNPCSFSRKLKVSAENITKGVYAKILRYLEVYIFEGGGGSLIGTRVVVQWVRLFGHRFGEALTFPILLPLLSALPNNLIKFSRARKSQIITKPHKLIFLKKKDIIAFFKFLN